MDLGAPMMGLVGKIGLEGDLGVLTGFEVWRGVVILDLNGLVLGLGVETGDLMAGFTEGVEGLKEGLIEVEGLIEGVDGLEDIEGLKDGEEGLVEGEEDLEGEDPLKEEEPPLLPDLKLLLPPLDREPPPPLLDLEPPPPPEEIVRL